MRKLLSIVATTSFIYAVAIFGYAYYRFSIGFSGHKVISAALSGDEVSQAYQIVALLILKTTLLIVALAISLATLFYWFYQSFDGIKKKIEAPEACSIASVFLSFLAIHYWNSLLFPHSQWKLQIPDHAESVIVYILTPILIIIAALGAYQAIKRISGAKTALTVGIPSIIVITLFFYPTNNEASHTSEHRHPEKPDIVILGIDSLRMDHLASFGGVEWIMPNLNRELTRSRHFKNAYTPLARTFPSWVSILTGEAPTEHGVRFNLMDVDYQEIQSKLITNILIDNGYTTAFATDERRFSNIDENFGFHKIIGPKMGVGDFLEGTINDFPLNNILLFAKYSNQVFPYTKLNRASYVTYNPDDFTNEVVSYIRKESNSSKPFFLATHFCLAHWPYTWRNNFSNFNDSAQYKSALNKVDQQISEVLRAIRASGRPTILIMLSDHGEAMGLKSDIPEPLTGELKHSEPLFGHGTNVASLIQHRVLLAFQTPDMMAYGPTEQLASLTDIKPTLESYLSPLVYQEYDGVDERASIDLMEWIAEPTATSKNRQLSIETGFSVSAIIRATPDLRDVVRDGLKHYMVTDNNRLLVKPESERLIIGNKSFAKLDASILVTTEKNGEFVRNRRIDIEKNKTISDEFVPAPHDN